MKKLFLFNILKNIINEEKNYDKLIKINQWYEDEKEKINKIKNFKLWNFKTKNLSKIYFKLINDLDKNDDDLYALRGNINNKYLYHYTNGDSLISILEDDVIETGGDGISFTTNSNLYKRGFVFWFSNEYSKGRNHTNTGVKIKLDFNKLKSNGYKFKVGNEYMGTHEGEEEIRYLGDEINNITNYIIEVILFREKESNIDEVENILKLKNIKYKIV